MRRRRLGQRLRRWWRRRWRRWRHHHRSRARGSDNYRHQHHRPSRSHDNRDAHCGIIRTRGRRSGNPRNGRPRVFLNQVPRFFFPSAVWQARSALRELLWQGITQVSRDRELALRRRNSLGDKAFRNPYTILTLRLFLPNTSALTSTDSETAERFRRLCAGQSASAARGADHGSVPVRRENTI